MTKEQFLLVLTQSSQLENKQIFDLEDIVSQFPFFQSARSLHLKGLKQQNSIRYNESLRTTAIHTADRSVLFSFITATNFNNILQQKSEEQIISDIELIDARVISNWDKFTANEDVANPENDVHIKNKLNELYDFHQIKSPEDDEIFKTEPIEQHEIQQDLSNKIDVDLDNYPSPETIENLIPDHDSNQSDYEIDTVDNSHEVPETFISESNNADSETISDEISIESQLVTDDYTEINHDNKEAFLYEEYTSESENDENQIIEEETKKIENQEILTDEIVFELLPDDIFSESIMNEIPETEPQTTVLFPNISLDQESITPVLFHKEDTFSFTQWLNLTNFKPIDRDVTKDVKRDKMELIDRFIINNPKIEPIEKNAVSDSVIHTQEFDNEVVMTETLARMYVIQKKYDEAQKAYEILSLKFPEKNTYFADQIKQIEILRKNR